MAKEEDDRKFKGFGVTDDVQSLREKTHKKERLEHIENLIGELQRCGRGEKERRIKLQKERLTSKPRSRAVLRRK